MAGKRGRLKVETLGPLLALPVPPANEQDRARVQALEHFHAMLSHGWIGKVVRAFLGPGMRSRERGADRLGSLSDASEITENALATQVQVMTGEPVKVAYGDQGYTGPPPTQDAAQAGIIREGVKLPAAKKGFVLLPRRGVVERSFGWMAHLRRLARDYERLPATLAGLHFLTFAILMLKRLVELLSQSP